jgi:hypothetical protein
MPSKKQMHTGLGDWTVESQRSHYTLGYWFMFVLGMLGQMVPDSPEITYKVRNVVSGEHRTITLPGDHGPSELAAAIARGQEA